MESARVAVRSAALARDTAGNTAQLHGIGLQRFGDRWYAYGENKAGGHLFQGVECYSTTDFVGWQHEGTALGIGAAGSITGPKRIIERPKVLRCPSTGRYVMYVHVEAEGEYSYAHVGTAIADSPTGPFEFLMTMQWRGLESRDIGVFQDEDGAGYLLSEDRTNGTHIYRLSEDYLSIVEDVACERGAGYTHGYESPTLVKRDDVYYWFGSQLTGWDPNDNLYSTAPELGGPWSQWRTFAPVGSRTFDSQCSVVLPLDADAFHSERFLYVGDRWVPTDLGRSPTVWLPIEVGEGVAKLDWHEEWSLREPVGESG